MSLPDFSPQLPLFGVQNLLASQFADDDRFRLFAEKIYPLLLAARPALANCYCAHNGRPGVEPVLLLGVSILQFLERSPDRQAMEMLKYHLGWKLALQMPLELAAPDPSTLVYFRQRLLENGQAKLAFDAVLAGLRAAGMVAKRGQRRLDSTHVLGAVARLSSLECLREALRLALLEIAEAEAVDRPGFWDELWRRYVEHKLDYRLEEAATDEKHLEAGRDALRLAEWAAAGPRIGQGPRMQVLGRVLAEQFEVVEGAVQKRSRRPAGSVQNPHDPQAQWSSKGKTGKAGWVGYKAQVCETVEEQPRQAGEPTASFLTAIETQEATGGEGAGMRQVQESQAASGLEAAEELYVDSGYVSAEALHQAKREGRELLGPALGSSHQPRGFRTEDFKVDVENRTAICPAGKTSSVCSRMEDKATGKVGYRFSWGGQCGECPSRQQCLGTRKAEAGQPRTLEVGQHHRHLQERRREQKSEAFGQRMHKRNAVEGTISELARGHGLRRARYRGLGKVRLQNYLIGAACNAKRWIRRLAWAMRQGPECLVKGARCVLESLRAAGGAAMET